MRHIPNRYHRKAERASYAAGYRAGFAGREAETEARHKDLQPMYLRGYGDGQSDKHNREVEREEEGGGQ